MNVEEFKKEVESQLSYIKIDLDNNQIKKLYDYMVNLIEWNQKINLTAIRNEKDIILKHFIDSISAHKYIEGTKLLDVGSGAGFPGIPLKIQNNDLEITLIDSVNKKVNFMKGTIQKLSLKKIEAIHVRAEELARDEQYREKFDSVISRAVANLSTLVEYMLPFVKVNGICICMKGPNLDEELQKAKHAIKLLGGELEKIINYNIDDENNRNIIIIRKIKSTEQTYPRKFGKPLKEPL